MEVRKRGAALMEPFPRCPAAVMGTKTRRRKAKQPLGGILGRWVSRWP